jgi:ATP-dependent DNA helicase RecG
MGFISKHLPEKFHLEGDQRINVRDQLFREIIGNLLVHREYVSPFPAKLIIDKFKVSTENWNKPHNIGSIDPSNFSPFPKNPMIARFFKEIGWVDELGSGVRNMYKFCELYTPETHPIFIEGDVFKAIIPLDKTTTQVTTQATTQVTTQMTTQMESQKIAESILELLIENPELSRKNLTDLIGEITEDGVRYHLDKLKKEGRIRRSGTTNGYWIVILDKEKNTTQATTQMTTQATTQMTTQMDSQNVQKRILELLIKTPTLSRRDLSELLGDITEDGVKYHLDRLKQEGIIKREGTTRGSWTIILKK